jgi:hypothetical protein
MTPREIAVGAGILVMAAAVRIPQLGHSLNEAHGFRQTQTAAVARAYAESGIDLLHTPLPVFGFGSDVPMEFPLVQAAGAVLIDAGLPSDAAMRAIGLLGFLVTIAFLGVLARRWHGSAVAGFAMLIAAAAPFGLAWGAASLIEFPATALALAMVLAGDTWLRRGHPVFLTVAALAGLAAFLVKATTAPVWCVLLGFAALAHLRETGVRAGARRVGALLLAGPALGVAAAAAWTVYADSIKAASPLTEFVTSSALREWNFGSLEQRLDADAYLILATRVTGEITGPLGLVLIAGVVGAAVLPGAERWRGLGWAATAVAGPAVFFNLYVVHSYYLSAVYPALCVALGLGVVAITRRFRRPVVVAGVGVLATAAVFVAGGTGVGRLDLHQWLVGERLPAEATTIANAVAPDEGIVLVGCDWSPVLPYYAERTAAMLRVPNAEFWTVEDIGRYPAVYNCKDAVDLEEYLPSSVDAEPTGTPGLFTIVPSARG